ncbi:MAG: hypothetical protein ABIO74_07535 [Dokdonella sp.]
MSQKTIAIIGVSEAETAHLRLLMRKGASALDHQWEWGDEGSADLLVVDTRSFSGQMARTRAQGAGMRYAIFSDAPLADADLVLPRPLTFANVIAVLNRAGNAAVPRMMIGANSDDFYTRDLGDESAAPAQVGAYARTSPAPGLDEILRTEPIELRDEHERPSAPMHLSPLLDASRTSDYDECMRDAPPAPHGTNDSSSARKYATRESMLLDTAPRSLREYLADALLQMPARYALPGAPPLTLDPKNRIAHAPAALGELAPYCHARWRLCDWQGLTTAELADIRETQTTVEYSRLVWLDVLLHSGGELARHLDPGGIYRLTQWSGMDDEADGHLRLAAALLQPVRLHEAAATAGVPMAEVFDFINACDAIGLIQWQPRPPRERDDARPPSLMQRLLNPFSKS